MLVPLRPNGDSQQSVEPFSLDDLTLGKLAEKVAKHPAAYLAYIARVEVLDTMWENQKAVELLDRQV